MSHPGSRVVVVDRDGKPVSAPLPIDEARGYIFLLNLRAGEYRYSWEMVR